jgi:hypothetical protein
MPVHDENGEIKSWSHVHYFLAWAEYTFKGTEYKVAIIDRDGAPHDDIRMYLEREYTDNGVSGVILELKDENGVKF